VSDRAAAPVEWVRERGRALAWSAKVSARRCVTITHRHADEARSQAPKKFAKSARSEDTETAAVPFWRFFASSGLQRAIWDARAREDR
jgi:hypothetical protein